VTDAEFEAALAGIDVFDAHQHHGHLDVVRAGPGEGLDVDGADAGAHAAWLDVERAARLAQMDRLGIGRALLMPANSYLCAEGVADTRRVNDGIRAYLDAAPDRFPAGLGVAEPLHGRAALDEIRRCHDELGLAGIQYHSRFQQVATDSPFIHRHLELLGELGMLAYVHSHADSALEAPHLVGALATAFPDLPIVVLDACSGYRHSLECLELAERHPNLRFEISLAFNLAPVAQLVERFGAERVLYGTDIYSHPNTFETAHTPVAVLDRLGPEAAAKVLGGNLEALLGWGSAGS
jgi:predicted TIM-barrel fold metal-dependent hydrolase